MESAHLGVFNDLLNAMNSGFDVLLVMLDLSSALDMVDRTILLSRLLKDIWITGTQWCSKLFEKCTGMYVDQVNIL